MNTVISQLKRKKRHPRQHQHLQRRRRNSTIPHQPKSRIRHTPISHQRTRHLPPLRRPLGQPTHQRQTSLPSRHHSLLRSGNVDCACRTVEPGHPRSHAIGTFAELPPDKIELEARQTRQQLFVACERLSCIYNDPRLALLLIGDRSYSVFLACENELIILARGTCFIDIAQNELNSRSVTIF